MNSTKTNNLFFLLLLTFQMSQIGSLVPSCADLSWNELQKEIQLRQRPEILTLSLQRVIGALDADCIAILNGDPSGAPSLPLSPTTFEEELKESRRVGRSILNYTFECDDIQEDSDTFARALLWAGRAYWLYMYRACPETKRVWKWAKATLDIEYDIDLALQATPAERGYDSDDDVLAINLDEYENLEVEVPVQPEKEKPPMKSVVQKVEPARKAPKQQEPARRASATLDTRCYRCWKAGHRFNECPEPKRIKSVNRRRGRRGSKRGGKFVTPEGR